MFINPDYGLLEKNRFAKELEVKLNDKQKCKHKLLGR